MALNKIGVLATCAATIILTDQLELVAEFKLLSKENVCVSADGWTTLQFHTKKGMITSCIAFLLLSYSHIITGWFGLEGTLKIV